MAPRYEEVAVPHRQTSDAFESSPQRVPLSRRLFLGTGAAAAAGATLGLTTPASADPRGPGGPHGETPFGPVDVAGGKEGFYPRVVRITGGQPAGKSKTLLATYQGSGEPVFPLYRSDDNGRTWSEFGHIPLITDFALQPFLYELPRAFAGLPKGALLFSCNGLADPGTNIQIYASTDSGRSWEFLSTVAQGGPPSTTNGDTPVWEPFLLLHKDKLICYYSDQRDPNFGQKLAHQTSTDLRAWGPVVDDATGQAYAERPGMTSVARLRGDLWIMTFEYGKPDDPENPNQDEYSYHVYYRLARDPESFRFSEDLPLIDRGSDAPNGAPIVSWSSWGGPNGTIIVTDNDHQDFHINRHLGDPAKWERLSSPIPPGYSRFTLPLDGPGNPHDRGLVFVITGAQYGETAPVQAGIISVRD